MKKIKSILILLISLTFLTGSVSFRQRIDNSYINESYVSYTVDPTSQNIDFYWKNDAGNILRSIGQLKKFVESKNLELVFAMNGGMFKPDHSPQGLFIQGSKIITPLDTSSGYGNFYMKPNGVFYITSDNVPFVCKTGDFPTSKKIKLATQSGPLLLDNGKIHSAFKKGSSNLNIRNGVGILSGNKLVFAMSKVEVNFYDFATYFKSLGCKNALYLDGSISRTYLPEKKWIQSDGDFGIIIAVTKPR